MGSYTENLGLFKYDPITDAKNTFNVKLALNDNFDKIDEQLANSGGGLEICDIGMALYVDETKGLRRYLNGQIVDINANTQAFLNRLKQITTLHPSLLCTEDEWQTAKTMSKFGQVGKFVFNYADDGETVVSVRIPRVVNIQGVFDLQNLGLTVEAGLPTHTHTRGTMNITGKLASLTDCGFSVSGAFGYSTSSAGKNGIDTSNNATGQINFDASRAWTGETSEPNNAIYGNSDTVQQEQIQYPYFIQVATGAETEDNIINEIELNNPFSLLDYKFSEYELNNISWLRSNNQYNSKAVYPAVYDLLLKIYNGTETKAGVSVKLATETFTDYDFVLNTAEETFRLPTKVKLASGKAVVGNGYALGFDDAYGDGANYIAEKGSGENGVLYFTDDIFTPLYAGDTVTQVGGVGNHKAVGITPNPDLSGIETSDSDLYLYFYVGETVQNANLINAGRIEEALVNKADKTEIDGEWVTPLEYNPIIEDVNLNSSTYLELDLTEFLPKDNNIYECIISGTVTTGSTSGNNAYISLKQLNNNDNWFDVCRAQTRSSSAVGGMGSCVMPIGIDRKITLYRGTSLNGTANNIKLNAYRKAR